MPQTAETISTVIILNLSSKSAILMYTFYSNHLSPHYLAQWSKSENIENIFSPTT